MNLLRILFTITFIAFPSYTYSANSCMDQAKRNLEQCLKDKPESQWGVCEQRYYRAIAKCK